MQIYRWALHDLYAQNEYLIDKKGKKFDALQYSAFKYGAAKVADLYGKNLFYQYITSQENLLEEKNIWITSSAFKYVPTASDSIATSLLNHWQELYTHQNIEKVKIGRNILFESDYGNLSSQERQNLMNQVDLFFDFSMPKKFPNTLIVIDDIRITGAHEQKMLHFIQKHSFEKVYLLYVANLCQKASPTTEHLLNHSLIKEPAQLSELWKENGFILNARICKFLLAFPQTNMIIDLVEKLPFQIFEKIIEGIKKDEYCFMEMYQKNWKMIEECFENCYSHL